MFSDDLGMAGAKVAGSIVERANAALTAGCDLILSCNDPANSAALLESLSGDFSVGATRLAKLRRTREGDYGSFAYLEARQHVAVFVGGEMVRDRLGLSDVVQDHQDIFVMQALSGG